jgi:hypothetical protein
VSDDLSIPRPTYRVPKRSRLTPATQRLFVYAGVLVAAIGLLLGVAHMFDRRTGPVPVVEADSRPIRVKPENPGGMQIPGVNGPSASEDGSVAKLAPPPETPDPAALTQPPSPAPSSAASSPVAPANGAAPAQAAMTAVPPAAKAGTDAGAAKPAVPTTAVIAPPAAQSTPKVALVAPNPAPAVTEPHPPVKAVAGKTTAIQLAALSSEESAKSEWQRISKRWPDLFGGRSPAFQKVDHEGHVVWRLRVAGFSDTAQAKAFCDQLHARHANCAVADF